MNNEQIINEIYELENRLTNHAQITRITHLIEMPIDVRPPNSSSIYEAVTAIVNWAEGDEHGKDYRLHRLKNLKETILNVIGTKNLPSNNPSEQSIEFKCSQLLSSLNCDEQRDILYEVLNLQLGGAFLVQERQSEIQNWLVKNLTDYAKKYIAEKQDYYNFSIITPMKVKGSIKYDFENGFLTEFKRICKIPNSQCVIEGLIQLGTTQSLIITIYGVRFLTDEVKRKFYDLWKKLWTKFRNSNHHSCLLLLFIEEDGFLARLSPFEFIDIKSSDIQSSMIMLPIMEKLEKNHITSWLENKEVDLQIRCIFASPSYINFLKQFNWTQDDPLCILNEICQTAFNMREGIAAIESYWESEA